MALGSLFESVEAKAASLPPLELAAVGLLVLLAVSFIRLLAKRQRLAGIPGPWLAQYSDVWRWHAQNKPGWSARLFALHQKYGPLVRLGPNHVSVGDPSAIPIVYSTSPVWEKGPSYFGAAPIRKGNSSPTIISMNEAQHTAVRKAAGRAFTTASLLDYESSIEAGANDLVAVLTREAAKGEPINLVHWLQCFAMDLIMYIAFSDPMGFLRTGDDVDGVLAAVMGRFDHWNAWAAMPGADYLCNKNAVVASLRAKAESPLARVGLSKMTARRQVLADEETMAEKGLSDDDDERRQQTRKDLLGKCLDGQAKYPGLVSHDAILGIIMSTIGAGADTTAGTLAYTLFLLCQNPAALATLRAELEEAALSSPPTWTEVHRLPYLEAVLKESMRVIPIAAWGIDRIVPATGATVCGRFLPPGTIVGCQIDTIHHDVGVFGADSADFRPERWLEADDDHRRRMDRAFLAFSTGKRTCTGIHIAWLEMKKTLPLVVEKFNFSLVNPEQDVVSEVRVSAVKYPPPIMMNVTMRTSVPATTE